MIACVKENVRRWRGRPLDGPAAESTGCRSDLVFDGLGIAYLVGAGLVLVSSQTELMVVGSPILAGLLSLAFAILLFRFAALHREKRAARDLLQLMSGPMRALPLTAFPTPSHRWPQAIMSAVAVWSAHKEQELSFLRSRTERDFMTMIPSRWFFKRQAEAMIAKVPADQSAGAMIMVGVDTLVAAGDPSARDAGEDALLVIARRISQAAERAGGPGVDVILGRLEDDEFTILVPALTTEQEALLLGRRLQSALSEPIEVEAGSVTARCSIGMVIGRSGEDFSSLLTSASMAMYTARLGGPNRIAVYSADMARDARATVVSASMS